MEFIVCQNCERKLLKIGQFDFLSIKCRRCGHMNHYRTLSTLSKAVQETPTFLNSGETIGHSSQNL